MSLVKVGATFNKHLCYINPLLSFDTEESVNVSVLIRSL